MKQQKSKDTPLMRGKILFSGIVWATFPVQGQFDFNVLDIEGEGCRVVYANPPLISTWPLEQHECERMIEAFLSITPPAPPQQIHDQQDDYGES